MLSLKRRNDTAALVKLERARLGLTQAALAERVGVPVQVIAQLETGRSVGAERVALVLGWLKDKGGGDQVAQAIDAVKRNTYVDLVARVDVVIVKSRTVVPEGKRVRISPPASWLHRAVDRELLAPATRDDEKVLELVPQEELPLLYMLNGPVDHHDEGLLFIANYEVKVRPIKEPVEIYDEMLWRRRLCPDDLTQWRGRPRVSTGVTPSFV